MLAVLKANAYGHGALRCAQALADQADGFAVAFLAEALALRAGGIRAPILVLEGAFSMRELEAAHAHGLWTVVHHADQLRMIEQAPAAVRDLDVWLKVDSGMRRAGFLPHAVRDAHARLAASGKVARLTLMSHFASADEPDAALTREQIAAFDAATAGLPGARSLSNSAGVLAWPEANSDWARTGILLYGANPVSGDANELQPVMRLQSEVFAERTLEPGDVLGYGASFVAARKTRVGLVAMGYADGYPRSAATGTPVGGRRPADAHAGPRVDGHDDGGPERPARRGRRQPGRALGHAGAGRHCRQAGRHDRLRTAVQREARAAGLRRSP